MKPNESLQDEASHLNSSDISRKLPLELHEMLPTLVLLNFAMRLAWVGRYSL